MARVVHLVAFLYMNRIVLRLDSVMQAQSNRLKPSCSGAKQRDLTDEGDSADVRVITDEVDGVVRTVDDVDDAIGHAGLLQ